MATPRRGFTIHHNGPPANCVGEPHSRCEAFWRAVKSFHVNDLGWSDIAYSFGTCPHGERFEGRGWDKYQFANGSDTVGEDDGDDDEWYTVLVFVGGDDSTGDNEPPTTQMVEATAALIDEGRGTGRCGDRVLPHNAFKPKPCPGPEFEDLAAAWDGAPSPLHQEDWTAMFDDLAHFRREVAAIVRDEVDARHKAAGTDTRQAIFDLARAAAIQGAFLCWAENAVTGDPVYLWTTTGKIQMPQGCELHNWWKAELTNRGQSPNARRLPVPVLEQWPTLHVVVPGAPGGDPGE